MNMLKLTINLADSTLDEETQENITNTFISELKGLDEILAIHRVSAPHLPSRSKSLGGFLVGIFTAEVTMDNAKQVLGYLGNRLSGKPIELEVEANGKHLKVKAHGQKELADAIQAAQNFIAD